MRGEIFTLRSLRTRGHEQQGHRYAVIVQSDDLSLSPTVLIAPTSTSARSYAHRPRVVVERRPTNVLVEHTVAVDHGRLGKAVGRVSLAEMQDIDEALRIVLGLR